MGNLNSTPSHYRIHSMPGLDSPLFSSITHIVARKAPSVHFENTWTFSYRLNFLPIDVGYRVALYCNAEDPFNPDPSQRAAVYGWIDAIAARSPNWLMFRIQVPGAAGPALLQVPYVFVNSSHFQSLLSRLNCFSFWDDTPRSLLSSMLKQVDTRLEDLLSPPFGNPEHLDSPCAEDSDEEELVPYSALGNNIESPLAHHLTLPMETVEADPL